MADKFQNNHHKIAILGIIDSHNMQHLYKNVKLRGCKDSFLILQPSFAMVLVPHLEKSNVIAKSNMATTSLQNCIFRLFSVTVYVTSPGGGDEYYK